MPETLLDFDTADASGDRGAVAQQNLKARGWKLRPKKVSQRALKPLKVFAHVNLCARLGLGADLALGLRILALESRDEFGHRRDRLDRANALPASPDVAPSLGF